MPSDDLSKRAKSFEHGADEYERRRPEFPAEVFATIGRRAGDRLTGRVLEVGAGTGRATLPLVRMGAAIDVVEPSQEMLETLAGRLRAAGVEERVRLRRATFEDVDPAARYDLVIAAQSFHWADPATRWSRLASLIRADGMAFLFWNGWHLDPAAHDEDAVRRVYDTLGQRLEPDLDDNRSGAEWAVREIAAQRDIRLLATDVYEWPQTLDVTDYLGLLTTTSQYAIAPASQRDALFAALTAVLGRGVTLRGRTLLITVTPTEADDS